MMAIHRLIAGQGSGQKKKVSDEPKPTTHPLF
jgi:hypothetical protein